MGIRKTPTSPGSPCERQKMYPPFLAALIDQDIAKGRIRQALGSFDLNLNSGGAQSLAGPNDGAAGYALLDQPLPFWGEVCTEATRAMRIIIC